MTDSNFGNEGGIGAGLIGLLRAPKTLERPRKDLESKKSALSGVGISLAEMESKVQS